jgi:membrane protease YdiL (CAAX protease family)
VLGFGPIAFGPWREVAFKASVPESKVSQLPTACLILTIVIVAAAEELLYRSYAIRRLFDFDRLVVVASIVSVVAFGLAHVPM